MEKIDMSLDDIIKMEGISSGRGRSSGRVRGPKLSNKRRVKSNMGNQINRNRVFKAKLRTNRQALFKRASRLPDKWAHDMFEATERGSGFTQLLVSNLEYGVSEADIRELFSEFGYLASASVHYDRSGRSLGTADVIFTDRNEAIAAMKQYNGVPLDGRPMKITMVPGGNPTNRGTGNFGIMRANKFNTMKGRNRGRGGFNQGGQSGRRGLNRKIPTAEELDADLDAYVNK